MNNQEKPSAFGRSLKLVDGDLYFSSGDLAVVENRENFLQGMKLMIETPFGTDIFNVNYGFDLLNSISQPESVRLIKELIRLNIVKSLSIDDRVREIKEVVFDDDPRYFELNSGENAEESRLTPREKAQRRHQTHNKKRMWRALVVLQLIPEGEVSLKLEGIGL
jgi:hypothetical protein